jgi:hypothetical protein
LSPAFRGLLLLVTVGALALIAIRLFVQGVTFADLGGAALGFLGFAGLPIVLAVVVLGLGVMVARRR